MLELEVCELTAMYSEWPFYVTIKIAGIVDGHLPKHQKVSEVARTPNK